VQKLLGRHVFDLVLININVHLISCACAKKFYYLMDDEVTKCMIEIQNNTLSMYTKCI